MKRVCVIGCGGSGKTTFSKKLAALTNLPLIHLDMLYWYPGWVIKPQTEFDDEINHILKQSSWIMDGNYIWTLPKFFNYTDTIIWLDYSTWHCLCGVFKRLIQNFGRTRDDMAPGCKEHFDLSFIEYVFNFRRTKRPEIIKHLNTAPKTVEILIFLNPHALESWLSQQN